MNIPHDPVAEQAVLGSLLLGSASPGELSEVFVRLVPEAFHAPAHGAVFAAMRDLFEQNIGLDEIAVAHRLAERDELAKAGGYAGIAKLIDSVASSANLPHYVGIVRDAWVRRRLLNAAAVAQSLALDETRDALDAVDEAGQAVASIAASRAECQLIDIRDLVRDEFKLLEQEREHPESIRAVNTGFYELDELTSGLRPPDVIYIAGRPSMGKTALATDIVLAACVAKRLPTLFVSIEMGRRQIMQRLLAARARIPLERLRNPLHLVESDWPKLAAALGVINEAPLRIVDRARTVLEIKALARSMKSKIGLELLVIDYLQIMRAAGRHPTRDREVAEISESLKDAAKELDVPVVVLSQLNRSNASRENKRPVLSDLRDSGAIEQDADGVIFVHRPEYYDPEDHPGEAEFIVAKQRNGATGTAHAGWAKQYASFHNLARGDQHGPH